VEVVLPADGQGAPSLDGLRNGELHLWYAIPGDADGAAAPDDTAHTAALERLLSPEELARCRTLTRPRGRREYLLTRALVRVALSTYAPVAPQDFRFRAGPHGRPELDPPSPLRFNLSNSDGLVACLVGLEREVGVDLEPFGRADDVLDLAARICAPAELTALAALPGAAERTAHALALWTLKEAYVKARGLGLSLPVGSLTFTLGPGAIALTCAPEADAAPGRWHFRSLELEGHRVAVAAGRSEARQPPARLALYPISRVDTWSGSKWCDA
jgi:4'-phosphopantetheinyl transferase